MGELPPGRTPPSNTFQTLMSDVARFNMWLRLQFRALIDYVFDITQPGAFRRRRFVQILGVTSWFLLAMISHPPPLSLLFQEPLTVMLEFGKAFVAPDVLRHVIVAVIAYRIALRHAGIYLDDIFELSDVYTAERYIRQAAFASQYDRIVIREGAVAPDSRNSPITRIGGPGLVHIHMENAALFEKIGGEPHNIGALGGSPVLESFERLREVIDLRDQVVDLTVSGRSKDGIPIIAKDVRLVFSIYRGDLGARVRSDFSQPYAYTDEAVRNLIYSQNSEPWTGEMRSLIREHLRRFIAQHTLTEFLANVSPLDEIETASQGSNAAAQSGLTGSAGLDTPGEEDREADETFVPRDKITNLFYDFTTDFAKKAETLGVQLQWIGLGTWQTPSAIIPEQHLKAWHMSLENHLRGNPLALQEVRRESRTDELLRLVREVPITSFGRLKVEKLESEQIVRELLLTYREKLRNAWEVYQNSDQPPPVELEASLKHITRLTARWVT